MTYNDFLNVVVYIYAKSPSYLSTQKIIRILYVLLQESNFEFSFVIEKVVDRYFSKIMENGYINDFIDIIIFLSKNSIALSSKKQDRVSQLLKNDSDALLLANYALYQKNDESSNYINEIIKKNINKINWEDFFLDKRSWWIFIFYSWPKLSKENQDTIDGKLEEYIATQKENNSRLLILNFLKKEDRHFINWDCMDDGEEQYYFYTRNRTVFNPNAIDSLSISF